MSSNEKASNGDLSIPPGVLCSDRAGVVATGESKERDRGPASWERWACGGVHATKEGEAVEGGEAGAANGGTKVEKCISTSGLGRRPREGDAAAARDS